MFMRLSFFAVPSAAAGGLVVRDTLQHRSQELDLESRVGKYTVVNANTPLAQRGGFYCSVCDCLLKDSISYLDHVNGRKHQQALGMSMRVERSTVSQIKDRLDMHKRKQEEEVSKQSVEDRLQAFDEEERARKIAKKDKKKKKKEQGGDVGAPLYFVVNAKNRMQMRFCIFTMLNVVENFSNLYFSCALSLSLSFSLLFHYLQTMLTRRAKRPMQQRRHRRRRLPQLPQTLPHPLPHPPPAPRPTTPRLP